MKILLTTMLAVAVAITSFPSQAIDVGYETGAGAAGGYCLAKHPYWLKNGGSRWTEDGYEAAAAPGLVAAVRRNFVARRQSPTDGERQMCPQACAQWGKVFGVEGHPLRQIINNSGTQLVINSGLGDIGATTRTDNELPAIVTAFQGTYIESDTAYADFCCCHAGPPQALPSDLNSIKR